MLRFITKSKWGADPCVSLQFYRSYIRSILDYGCVLYDSATNTHLKILDRIQFKALRIRVGAVRSSPCPAILAEYNESPLDVRRKYLAHKLLIKYRSSNTLLTGKISVASVNDRCHPYWRHKRSPLFVTAFTDTSKFQ
ncbi:unnamed protein product [Acanthoscelides obtectus]|uniref:Uncharacterized protein n=1 Tax=Acanthoscelides obtectus TaxID=200917 RepID=A0A9P0K8D4_ACAOB|nr:unnamed protein product [Acanthoscelides obtectus]CAK1665934.1 hypothetical protein AOBTE_LOCUS25057 [Acanthoscelides obtectus]